MTDPVSGIDLMRRRMERGSRQPPASRRPRTDDSEPAPAALDAAPVVASPPLSDVPPTVVSRPPRRRRGVGEASTTPLRLSPDEAPVNLAIRVRKTLDDRLADTIHALRGAGVRTSKVELIEMLLWESADADADAVRGRLRLFREHAPRGANARLDD